MILPNAIPGDLRQFPNWVGWNYAERKGKRTKVPVCVFTGKDAASNRPDEWSDFETALAYHQNTPTDGIGCVFTLEMGMVGVDLDKSIREDGEVEDWAAPIIKGFDTYTERSPSGRGVKMWCYGVLPDNKGRRGKYKSGEVEMYSRLRYFTVTGNSFTDQPKPIAERQRCIDRLYELVFPVEPEIAQTTRQTTHAADLTDVQAIEKLTGESTGKGRALWRGDISGYTSQSEAELALMTKIAFYVRSQDRVIALARQSGLFRAKMTRDDYMTASAEKGIRRCGGTFYDGNGRKPPEVKSEPIAPPPVNLNDLERNLGDTINGKRFNVPWPWPMLTHGARALSPGTVTIVCGGAGAAKSLFVSQAMIDWHAQDVNFATFMLEEDRAFFLLRVFAQLANESRLTLDDWTRDNAEQVGALYKGLKEPIGQIAERIWDAPNATITLDDLIEWQAARLKEGRRILVIDPITAADSGREPWIADMKFINESKRLMRQYGASLVIVTHPRGGPVGKGGDHLDQLAGGRAYNRFTSTVLWMDAFESDYMKIRGDMGTALIKANRSLRLSKTRSAPGSGWHIAYEFNPNTLKFRELGIIVKDKK